MNYCLHICIPQKALNKMNFWPHKAEDKFPNQEEPSVLCFKMQTSGVTFNPAGAISSSSLSTAQLFSNKWLSYKKELKYYK